MRMGLKIPFHFLLKSSLQKVYSRVIAVLSGQSPVKAKQIFKPEVYLNIIFFALIDLIKIVGYFMIPYSSYSLKFRFSFKIIHRNSVCYEFNFPFGFNKYLYKFFLSKVI